jgi:hypothetical protein
MVGAKDLLGDLEVEKFGENFKRSLREACLSFERSFLKL